MQSLNSALVRFYITCQQISTSVTQSMHLRCYALTVALAMFLSCDVFALPQIWIQLGAMFTVMAKKL